MTGDRVRENYYRNWTYKEEDGAWHFLDNRFEDHGPFNSYEKACRAIDDYLRGSMHGSDKENTVGKAR
jgi:hypothetical protein